MTGKQAKVTCEPDRSAGRGQECHPDAWGSHGLRPIPVGVNPGGDAQNGGCCISQRWGNFKTLLPPPSDPAQGRC